MFLTARREIGEVVGVPNFDDVNRPGVFQQGFGRETRLLKRGHAVDAIADIKDRADWHFQSSQSGIWRGGSAVKIAAADGNNEWWNRRDFSARRPFLGDFGREQLVDPEPGSVSAVCGER